MEERLTTKKKVHGSNRRPAKPAIKSEQIYQVYVMPGYMNNGVWSQWRSHGVGGKGGGVRAPLFQKMGPEIHTKTQ